MDEKTSKHNHSDSIDEPVRQSDKTSGSSTDWDTDGAARVEKGGYENSKEPTRYGDWEIAGRCIDF